MQIIHVETNAAAKHTKTRTDPPSKKCIAWNTLKTENGATSASGSILSIRDESNVNRCLLILMNLIIIHQTIFFGVKLQGKTHGMNHENVREPGNWAEEVG